MRTVETGGRYELCLRTGPFSYYGPFVGISQLTAVTTCGLDMLRRISTQFSFIEDLIKVCIQHNVRLAWPWAHEPVPTAYKILKGIVEYHQGILVFWTDRFIALIIEIFDYIEIKSTPQGFIEKLDRCHNIWMGVIPCHESFERLDGLADRIAVCPADRAHSAGIIETILRLGGWDKSQREREISHERSSLEILPPCISSITLRPASLAHPIARSSTSSCPWTNGSPGMEIIAQYPMGIRTWFSPAPAIWTKSSWVIQEFQCVDKRFRASGLPRVWVYVYSSLTLRFVAHSAKIDGVIHGSKTNQPPRLTPRTLETS